MAYHRITDIAAEDPACDWGPEVCRRDGLVQVDTGRAQLWRAPERLAPLPTFADLLPRAPEDLSAYVARTMAARLHHYFALGLLRNTRIFPLPHQFRAANRFLTSPTRRLLLADDVGLGKTIEAGLIIALLQDRADSGRGCENCLVIAPAQLTRHWRDTLVGTFGLRFGAVAIDAGEGIIDHDGVGVIISRDKAKRPEVMERLRRRDWDLIVVDECHHLTRTAMRSWHLANRLIGERRQDGRPWVLLLSATPHSGNVANFLGLLSILAPEHPALTNLGAMNAAERRQVLLEHGDDLLRKHFFRQRKNEVCDARGQPLFPPRETRLRSFKLMPGEQRFHALLDTYLQTGYDLAERERSAGEASRERVGQALGFVMATYQRLAASSSAAIKVALLRRSQAVQHKRRRLLGKAFQQSAEDETFDGETLEKMVTDQELLARLKPLNNEQALLAELLAALPRQDSKFACMWERMEEFAVGAATDAATDSSPKFLIFTEFLATQSYLAALLEKRFGRGRVVCLNGSLKEADRHAVCQRFSRPHEGQGDGARVLIATDAGGEGITLTAAHIMFNYDLPWNPMKVEQRIGRLHRYSQKRKVFVWNLLSDSVSDDRVQRILRERTKAIAQTLQGGARDHCEALESEILGMVSQEINATELYVEAQRHGWTDQQTRQRIDHFLARARDEYEELRSRIDSNLPTFSIEEYRVQTAGIEEVAPRQAFLRAFLAAHKKKPQAVRNRPRVFTVPLDASWRRSIKRYLLARSTDFSSQQRQRLQSESYGPCTFDPELAAADPALILLGGGDPLFDLLIRLTEKAEFGGLAAALGWPSKRAFEGFVYTFAATSNAMQAHPGRELPPDACQVIACDLQGHRQPAIEREFVETPPSNFRPIPFPRQATFSDKRLEAAIDEAEGVLVESQPDPTLPRLVSLAYVRTIRK